MLLVLVPGLLALAAVTWWAFRPLEIQGSIASVATNDAPSEGDTVDDPPPPPLDLTAFDVTLWHIPAEPSSPQSAEPTSPREKAPPLDVVLVGIVHEDGALRIALYDAAEDATSILSVDDELHGWRVASITPLTVELTHDRHTRILELEDPPRAWGREEDQP